MNNEDASAKKGKLYIVSTPIGNKDDISLRAINTIKRCDLIVCEEMKMGALTLKNLNLAKELIPLNENNESEMTMEVLNLLKSGKHIALISDAGTPVFADPGLYLVKSCISNNIDIEVVPGASSIMTALVRSGFELYEFLYAGFLPRKNEDRDRKLQKIARERRTVIIFETPYRLTTLLAACAEIMPERKVYLAMNLTMPFETHHYGTFDELYKKFENSKLKSEFVIVMEGNKEWINKKPLVDAEGYLIEDEDDDEEEVVYEYPVKSHIKQIRLKSKEDDFKPSKFGKKVGFKPGGSAFAKKRFGAPSDRKSKFPSERNFDGYSNDKTAQFEADRKPRFGSGSKEGGFSNDRKPRFGSGSKEGGFSNDRKPRFDSDRKEGGFSSIRKPSKSSDGKFSSGKKRDSFKKFKK
jgi:16S rRNA (cytidine1402-2'-O)-methyltransferase